MLFGLDPILSPDLLYVLRAMGHGDEIVLADANFPGSSLGPRVVRADGVDSPRLLRAVLGVMPLDNYVEQPALTMQVVNDPTAVPDAVAAMAEVVKETQSNAISMGSLERFAFYERARGAFAVVQSGENRPYGNIILTKGVVTGARPGPAQS